MLFELKDDAKEISYEAVGLALHLDSRTLALSYAALFDNLWKQRELYEKMEAHGDTICAQNNPCNKGATVSFTLPLVR